MREFETKKKDKVWHKVTMSVAKNDADMVRRAVQSLHCCGIETEDATGDREQLDAYFDDAIDASTLQAHMQLIAELISAAGGRQLKLGSIEAVPEEDWAEEWRRNWKPVHVSKRLVVCPSWEKYARKPGQTVVYVYPRMAFGTGSHPTTQMCLKLLERYVPGARRVIDIGAGSGILAVAAVKLGARSAVAVEMDDAAVENAHENCKHNRVASRVKIVCDRFGPLTRGRFDLGVCNMLSHELIPLIPDITHLLAGKGLIVSGLTEKSAAEFKQEMRQHGWHFEKILQEGEWLAFYAIHRQGRKRSSRYP